MQIEEASEKASFDTTHQWLRDYNAKFVTNRWVPVNHLAYSDDGELVSSLDGEIGWGKIAYSQSHHPFCVSRSWYRQTTDEKGGTLRFSTSLLWDISRHNVISGTGILSALGIQ